MALLQLYNSVVRRFGDMFAGGGAGLKSQIAIPAGNLKPQSHHSQLNFTIGMPTIPPWENCLNTQVLQIDCFSNDS